MATVAKVSIPVLSNTSKIFTSGLEVQDYNLQQWQKWQIQFRLGVFAGFATVA